MTRRKRIIFGISGEVKSVMLYCQTLLWGAEGLWEGFMKIALIVSSLEWLTYLLLFIIMVEFEKL